MRKTSQNVLIMDTIIIAHSNLLNLDFFTRFVLIWCALVYKLNAHVVKRTSSLKFRSITWRGKLLANTTILSSKIVVDGGIGGWRIRCILNVYILIRSLKNRAE